MGAEKRPYTISSFGMINARVRVRVLSLRVRVQVRVLVPRVRVRVRVPTFRVRVRVRVPPKSYSSTSTSSILPISDYKFLTNSVNAPSHFPTLLSVVRGNTYDFVNKGPIELIQDGYKSLEDIFRI